eukprot:scaffold1383_cov360-Prasinococcus_capsulatus_cf.AAC.3
MEVEGTAGDRLVASTRFTVPISSLLRADDSAVRHTRMRMRAGSEGESYKVSRVQKWLSAVAAVGWA